MNTWVSTPFIVSMVDFGSYPFVVSTQPMPVPVERGVGRPAVLVGDALQDAFDAFAAAGVQTDAEQGEPVVDGEPALFGLQARPRR